MKEWAVPKETIKEFVKSTVSQSTWALEDPKSVGVGTHSIVN